MRKLLSRAVAALGAAIVALLALSLVPVPPAWPWLCRTVEGRVASVTSPGSGDVAVWLEGDSHRYHINHGLDAGLDPAAMHARLAGRVVRLQVIRRTWSPLDARHQLAPVARITDADGVVFDVRLAGG